ncbi:MAG: ABC transporter permease [Planctomycetota bacterium]
MIWLRLARNVRLGIKTLLLHKLRSMLTMLGVVFGVSSVVAMLAVGEGASREALERIRMLGSNNIILESTKATDDQNSGNRRVNIYGLTYDDAARIEQSFSSVTTVVPVKSVKREGRLGRRTAELRVMGITPSWFELVPRPLVAGRRLIEADEASGSNAVVLTEHGARKLLATEETIGNDILINNTYYEVVGIVEAASAGSVETPDEKEDAYIALSTARDRFGDLNVQRSSGSFQRELVELHAILVQVDGDDAVPGTAAGIQAMLERFHSVRDYSIAVPLALLQEAQRTRDRWNIVLGSIAGISLLVGGIGIMNIMLASVTERTREIGIRRAIGAKKVQIISQFLIETIVLSVIGGLIGIALGFAIPWAVTRFAGMPTEITAWSIALAAGISVGVGVIFGLYPAARAANLDPIDALRHE